MATSKLNKTQLIFTSDGTDINARITASDDTLTLYGTGGVGNRITLSNLKDPSIAQDAATKSYVDSLVVTGVIWKNTARLATDGSETIGTWAYDDTSVITVTVDNTIDGTLPVDGDRVLVKNTSIIDSGTAANAMGIYIVSSVVSTTGCILTRTTDAENGSSANGAAIFIYAGDLVSPVNNDTTWVVTNDSAVNWGSAVVFTQMSAAPVLGPLTEDHMFIGDTNGDAKDGGNNLLFDYSTRASAPVLTLGGSATGTTTFNIGATGQAKNITSTGTGLMTISSGDAIALFGSTDATITAGTGTITVDGNSSQIDIGPTTTGPINVGSISAGNVTIDSAGTLTVGLYAAVVNVGSTFNGTTTTIDGEYIFVGIDSNSNYNTYVYGEDINVGGTYTTSLDLLAAGVGGNVSLTAGNVTTSGTVSISTVTATTATVSGGEIDFTAGNGNTTGAGGALDFNAGEGGATGAGGAITLNAGTGGVTSGSGGNVVIQGGSATVVGSAGNVVLKIAQNDTSTSTNNIIQFQSGNGSAIGRIENNGNMYATTFHATSDAKYKTNIMKLNDSLETINKIEIYSYNWKKDFAGHNNVLQYGVLAQQLEEAGLENLVAGSEESKAVNYLGLIPLLIGAVKELSKKLEEKNADQVPQVVQRKVRRPKKVKQISWISRYVFK